MALLALGVLVGSAVSPVQPSGAAARLAVALSPSTTVSNPAPALPTRRHRRQPRPKPLPRSRTPKPRLRKPDAGEYDANKQHQEPAVQRSHRRVDHVGAAAITHVFMIVLSDQGFNASFGPSSQATYLSETLTRQGELVDNFYGVAAGDSPNG